MLTPADGNLPLSQSVVLKRLRRLFWICVARKDIVKSKLTWKDVLHNMQCLLFILAIWEPIENVYVPQTKSDIALRIQARFRIKHPASHETDRG